MPPRRSNRIKNSQNDNQILQVTNTDAAGDSRKQKRTNSKRGKRSCRPQSISSNKSSRKDVAQTRVRPRPLTIRLDVTDSESDESDSGVEEIAEPSPTVFVLSNIANEVSDPVDRSLNNNRIRLTSNVIPSSDSECEEVAERPTIKRTSPIKDKNIPMSDSESDEDLYGVNYLKNREKAFEEVKEKCKNLKNSPLRVAPTSPVANKKRENKENLMDNLLDSTTEESPRVLNDSLDLDLENIDVSSIVLRGSAGKLRRNKNTKAALATLQAFSKRFQEDVKNALEVNDSFDDDILIDDNSRSGIPIRVRWGTDYLRHVITKDFVQLYQEFAEKYKVSVSQVVLSFKDSVISPETRPSDIGLSIGDIIDGGILNQTESDAANETRNRSADDKNFISLKVQTSNRKMSHNLEISRFDKMSVLMEEYSKLRNIPLINLKFMFDGDTIQPSDTPATLDLEGGECLDVFEK